MNTAKPKMSLRDRMLRAEELANRYLADANEARERGRMARAEQLYAKGQYWLDRYNLLAGNADRPPPRT